MSKRVKMDGQFGENGINCTPSTSAKRLVDKVLNSNQNCDNSPFKLLPTFSTPPSRFFKIRNPFDSPLVDRLHLPICSPGLFAKSTPNKEEKFRWSICDISHFKPAEIETTAIEEHQNFVDPSIESQIQEKISSFFSENSVVPSPQSREICEEALNNVSLQTNVSSSPIVPEHIENMLKSCERNEQVPNCSFGTEGVDVLDTSASYIPNDEYYKQLFEVGSQTPLSSPPMSTGDSPLQFSPLTELDNRSDSSFSERGDRKVLNECVLSPITSETDEKMVISVRESRSACRLIFTENMSNDNIVPEMPDNISSHGNFFDDTMKTIPTLESDVSNENWDVEYKHVSLASQDYDEEDCKMDVSLPHTPRTGLFTSQRKRLSDSFRDVLSNEELIHIQCIPTTSKAIDMPEGSSDAGYCSGSVMPSSSENTWNNSCLIASTPTKKKY